MLLFNLLTLFITIIHIYFYTVHLFLVIASMRGDVSVLVDGSFVTLETDGGVRCIVG